VTTAVLKSGTAFGMRPLLPSERIVVESPRSFAGSAKRIWKLTYVDSTAARVVLGCLAIALIATVWVFVAAWYMLFWMFAPLKLFGRSKRRRRREELRHRELMGLR
jgi:hypothetical protein